MVTRDPASAPNRRDRDGVVGVSWRWVLGWAFALTFAGILLGVALAPGPEAGTALRVAPPVGWVNPADETALLGRYLRLANWDSAHFYDIARNGYVMPEGPVTADDVRDYRANATFLPSFPVASRVFASVFPSQLSLLITAQIFCFVFWALLLLWFTQRGVPRGEALLFSWTLFAYPSSFYLVAGYTESLYLAGVVALVILTERVCGPSLHASLADASFGGTFAHADANPLGSPAGKSFTALGAGLCGAAITGARLVGFPIVMYSTMRAVLPRIQSDAESAHRAVKRAPAALPLAIVISVISSLGALGFFAYCQLRFGHWDLYFRLLEAGWGHQNSRFWFLFDPRNYFPQFFFEDTSVSLNRCGVPLAIGFLVWGARGGWQIKDFAGTALRITGVALLYLAMAGKAASGMDGMIRYSLPVVVVAVMAQAGGVRMPRAIRAVGIALFAAAQLYLFRRYLLGHWVS